MYQAGWVMLLTATVGFSATYDYRSGSLSMTDGSWTVAKSGSFWDVLYGTSLESEVCQFWNQYGGENYLNRGAYIWKAPQGQVITQISCYGVVYGYLPQFNAAIFTSTDPAADITAYSVVWSDYCHTPGAWWGGTSVLNFNVEDSIKAMGVGFYDDWSDAGHNAKFAYVIIETAADPSDISFLDLTMTPASKTFADPRNVVITCATGDAVIRYTTDGSDPSEVNGIQISSGDSVWVDRSLTLKARAWGNGKMGTIASATYQIPTNFSRPITIPQMGATVTIDGQLLDWADAQWAPLDQPYDGDASDIANAFYAAKWGSDGKVYVVVKVQETSAATYSFTDSYVGWNTADQVEIYLHTTGTVAGDILLQQAAQQYIVGITSTSHSQVWKSMIAGTAVPENADFQAAGSANVNGTIVYEVAMNAFEYFGGLANQPNILSPLAVGDVISLDVVVTGRNATAYTGMKAENMVGKKYESWANLGVHKLGKAVIAGDANDDGAVDVGDLGILAANYGQSNRTWAQGDFNGDGAVDVGDLGILAAHYGEGSTQASNFNQDYAKAFGTTVAEENAPLNETGSSICGALGLPMLVGFAFMMLMLVKLDE
jgi:hypothetical protein